MEKYEINIISNDNTNKKFNAIIDAETLDILENLKIYPGYLAYNIDIISEIRPEDKRSKLGSYGNTDIRNIIKFLQTINSSYNNININNVYDFITHDDNEIYEGITKNFEYYLNRVNSKYK